MSNFPEELRYTETHEWVKKDGNNFLVGISDFAQKELGDIVYIDFPGIGDSIDGGGVLGELESSKAVSEFNMPFAGHVLEVNKDLEDSPEMINKDPYGSWIVKISADDPDDYDNLMDSLEARASIEDN